MKGIPMGTSKHALKMRVQLHFAHRYNLRNLLMPVNLSPSIHCSSTRTGIISNIENLR